MHDLARRRDAHLERGRYHSAVGNVVAANAHFGRADELWFGVSGARQRLRSERPKAPPRFKELHKWYDFEDIALRMLHDAMRTDPRSVVHSVFVGPSWDRAKQNLTAVLKQALGAWEQTPIFTMTEKTDTFRVSAHRTTGKEFPRVVQLGAHPSRDGYILDIDVLTPPEFAGSKHGRDVSEHGARKRADYYDDGEVAMES